MKIAKSPTLALLAVITLALTACNTSSTSNQNSPNSNGAAVVESGPKKSLKAFYEALRKKDETGIKQALSKNSLEKLGYVDREMEQKNFNYFIYKFAFMREGLIGQSSDPNAQVELDVLGEKVESDKAVLELKNPETGQKTEAKFVREDGVWKLDILNQEPNSAPPASK